MIIVALYIYKITLSMRIRVLYYCDILYNRCIWLKNIDVWCMYCHGHCDSVFPSWCRSIVWQSWCKRAQRLMVLSPCNRARACRQQENTIDATVLCVCVCPLLGQQYWAARPRARPQAMHHTQKNPACNQTYYQV